MMHTSRVVHKYIRYHVRTHVPRWQRRNAAATAHGNTSPWNMIFDLRERETYWTDENKARLVKIVAKKSLDIPLEELQFRLDTVLAIIPDLDQRIVTMHPDNLATLLQDPEAAATALLQLRRALPLVNVSALAAKMPSLLNSDVIASLPEELAKVERLLGVQPPGELPEGDVHSAETFAAAISAQPLLLDSEGVEEALEELQRLMPAGTDVHAMLMRNPDYILRVQRGQKRIGLNPDSFPDSSYIDVQVRFGLHVAWPVLQDQLGQRYRSQKLLQDAINHLHLSQATFSNQRDTAICRV